MIKFFFLSLLCHLLLFSALFFLKLPKPPKVFQARVFISTPNNSKTQTSAKKKVTSVKKITTSKVKKSKPKQLSFPKIVTSYPLKIQGLDLENKNLNNLKIENLEQKFTPTDLELKEIQEQKPAIDLQHNQFDLDKKTSQEKPTISTQEDTKNIIDNYSSTKNIYIQNYQNLLASIVRNNWNHALQNNSLQTRVKIYISKDGNLLDYEIIKKSNVLSFDLSVVNALEVSTPFPPFPKIFKQDSEIFYFQFQGGGTLISQ